MRIAVVGMGLIGGSFYKAALAAGYEVVGLHHHETAGLSEADIIFVALPEKAIVPWITSNQYKEGAIVVDICGVKRGIVGEIKAKVNTKGWYFVGGHPMAGKEVSGYANSEATLFQGASMIITPYPETPASVIATLKKCFADLGFAMTVISSPEEHDCKIAFTSQLCHVIASTYTQDELANSAFGFSAGSYADMTRIATMDEDGWTQLFMANRDNLAEVISRFLDRMSSFKRALDAGDASAIKEYIRQGAEAKRRDLAKRKGANEA